MAYELHITRAEDWHKSNFNPIALDEWRAYVRSDSEMRFSPCATATTPVGDTLEYQSEALAAWDSYSKNGKGGNVAWFDFQNGEVVVKDPDREITSKMCRVAEVLRARVQGDDGEFYSEEPDTR